MDKNLHVRMIFQTLEGINTTAKHVTIPKFRNKKNDILAKILNTFLRVEEHWGF